MLKACLNRLDEGIDQTLGHLTLWDGLEKVFECVTLELPYEHNMTNISCVPKGVYKVLPRTSDKYKKHFILDDVPNRRYIPVSYTHLTLPTNREV